MPRLAGKTAIITGGAGFIGRAAARLFIAEGANVLLVDLNEGELKKIADEIGDKEHLETIVSDVTTPEGSQQYVKRAVERFGGVDVFLNNAGVEGVVTSIADYPVEDFDRTMAINVRGVWLGLKYVMPEMEKRGKGSIVITSSVSGIMGTAGMSAYCTSKHAVIGTMRVAALEGAAQNVRVNAICPASLDTRLMRSLEESADPNDPDKIRQMWAEDIPMKRYGQAEEVAQLMLFLASDESSYITGGVYPVDGGQSASD